MRSDALLARSQETAEVTCPPGLVECHDESCAAHPSYCPGTRPLLSAYKGTQLSTWAYGRTDMGSLLCARTR